MNILIRKVVFAVIFFSLFISLKAGFFDDFDTSKIVNNAVASALVQKPKVNDLIIAKGVSDSRGPVSPTNKFSPYDRKVYVFLEISNFIDEQDNLSADWSYHDKYEWTKLGSVNINPPEGATDVYFYISRNDGSSWPVGEYRIDIYVCKELSFTRFFNVEGSLKQTEQTVKFAFKLKPEIFNLVSAKGINSNNDPINVSEIFLPSDSHIYIFMNTKNINSTDSMTADWQYRNGTKWESLGVMSIEVPKNTTNVHFYTKRTDEQMWKPGDYRVAISVNGILTARNYFTIAGEPEQSSVSSYSDFEEIKDTQPKKRSAVKPEITEPASKQFMNDKNSEDFVL